MQKDILNHIHNTVTSTVSHLNVVSQHESVPPELKVAMLDAQISLMRLDSYLLEQKRIILTDTSHPIP